MKHKLNTDFIPLIPQPFPNQHHRANWPDTPESHRFNDGIDLLVELDHEGYYEGRHQSTDNRFSAIRELCEGLSDEIIDDITNRLNSI